MFFTCRSMRIYCSSFLLASLLQDKHIIFYDIVNLFTIETISLIAGTLTTLSFVPQVIKTWRSKSAKGLSLGMFSIFCIGLILWLIYGIALSRSEERRVGKECRSR